MYLRANLDHGFEDLSSVVVELGAGQHLRALSTVRISRPSAVLVRGNESVCKFYLRVYVCAVLVKIVPRYSVIYVCTSMCRLACDVLSSTLHLYDGRRVMQTCTNFI